YGHIGDREEPAQTAVSAKLCENADVELQKAHGTDFSRLSPYLLSAGGSGRGSTADGVGWTGAGVVQALKSASETFGNFLRKATIDQISSSFPPASAKLGMPVMLIPFLITQNNWDGERSPTISFRSGGSGCRPSENFAQLTPGAP